MNPSQLGRRFAALAVTITTLGTIALSAGPANAAPLLPQQATFAGAPTTTILVSGGGHISDPRMRG